MTGLGAAACPHGFPKPANCVECMEDGPVMAPEMPQCEQVVAASFCRYEHTECRLPYGCGLPIEMGDRIVLLDPSGAWVHEGCAP